MIFGVNRQLLHEGDFFKGLRAEKIPSNIGKQVCQNSDFFSNHFFIAVAF